MCGPLACGPAPHASSVRRCPHRCADILRESCYSHGMNAVKAKVVNGHFVIDEPTDLPEGTELYLVPVSEEDEDRLDIEAANQALAEAEASGEKPVPWSQVKTELGL